MTEEAKGVAYQNDALVRSTDVPDADWAEGVNPSAANQGIGISNEVINPKPGSFSRDAGALTRNNFGQHIGEDNDTDSPLSIINAGTNPVWIQATQDAAPGEPVNGGTAINSTSRSVVTGDWLWATDILAVGGVLGLGDSQMDGGFLTPPNVNTFIKQQTDYLEDRAGFGQGWTGAGAQFDQLQPIYPNAEFVVVNTAINDINGGNFDQAEMEAAFILNVRDPVAAAGMTLVMIECPPAGASANMNASKDAVVISWNAYLNAQAALSVFEVVQVYDDMGEPGFPTELAEIYVALFEGIPGSGDDLHYNNAAHNLIAGKVAAVISTPIVTSLHFGADTLITIPGFVPDGTQIGRMEALITPDLALQANKGFILSYGANFYLQQRQSSNNDLVGAIWQLGVQGTTGQLADGVEILAALHWRAADGAGEGSVVIGATDVASLTKGSNPAAETFLIGRSTLAFLGTIKEFKIWEGSNGVGPPLHHWKIDEGFGETVIIDSGSSPINGALTLGTGAWSDAP